MSFGLPESVLSIHSILILGAFTTDNQWSLLKRPREKLFEIGAGNLSDAELVSLLLCRGAKGKSARDLLQRFDGLAGLLSTNFSQIARMADIGPAKAASLAAMRELGHRQLYAEVQDRDVLSTSQATREYLRARFRYCKSEIFSCIFLTNQHHILRLDELFQGTIDVRVLDHLIDGSTQVVYLAERGYIA